MAMAVAFSAASRIASAASIVMTPSSSAHGLVITSRSRCSKTVFREAGAQTVRIPAPARRAASAVRHGAPVFPVEPPTTSTEPAVYLLSLGPRRGTSREDSLVDVLVASPARREADVGHLDLPCVETAGRDHETDLAPVERDRRLRLDRGACDLTGGRVDAARHVDREDRRSEAVQRLDEARRFIARLSGKPGPEERVDGDVAATGLRERDLELSRTFEVLPGVAGDLVFRPREHDFDSSSRLLELARDHEAVAAVGARPAPDRDAAAHRGSGCRTASAAALPARSMSSSIGPS